MVITLLKEYNTRGKANLVETGQEELATMDSTPLCMSVLTPTMDDTPVCSTLPTPRTPSTPPGLLGEVFRRRSTPTAKQGEPTTPDTHTLALSTSNSIDLLDNVHTQTLNDLLDVTLSQQSLEDNSEDVTLTTPVKPLPAVTNAKEADANSTACDLELTPVQVAMSATTSTPTKLDESQPTEARDSPRKRKITKPGADKAKKLEKKRKKKEKQRTLEDLAHNQSTISQQLIDFDLKLEGLTCALNKANLTSFMENITEKLKEIRAVAASPQPAPVKQSHRHDELDCELLPPPPPEICEEPEVEWLDLKRIILAQQNTIDLLNGEIDDKNNQIKELCNTTDPTTQQLKASLAYYKTQCHEKDSKLSEYMTASTEWDLFRSKQANQLQYAEEEIIDLKNQLETASNISKEQADKLTRKEETCRELENENLALKKEAHNTKINHEKHPRSPKSKSKLSRKSNQEAREKDSSGGVQETEEEEADLVFIHDSLGKGITPGIMSRFNLRTTKMLAYTQEQARESIDKIVGKPKVVILHVGTNDVKNGVDADIMIKNYDRLIKQVNRKLPDTKVVLSNIVPREDDHILQETVEYVNAAVNRKCANLNNVSIVRNNDIFGRKLKALDLIHLTEPGTSRMASHIKDSVLDALKIQ